MSKSTDATVIDYLSKLLDDSHLSQSTCTSNKAKLAAQSKNRAQPIAAREQEAVQVCERLYSQSLNPQSSKAQYLKAQSLDTLLAPTNVNEPEVYTTNISQPKQTNVIDPSYSRDKTLLSNKATSEQLSPDVNKSTAKLQQLIDGLDDEFQVLFFKVAELTLAVPLTSLGGIIKMGELTSIIGTPHWHIGVTEYRSSQLNVIDTERWLGRKPRLKENPDTQEQFIVVLANSRWGLRCDSLINAVKINKSDVNWRNGASNRPWLAGVIKEKMCGMLNVAAMIDLIDAQ